MSSSMFAAEFACMDGAMLVVTAAAGEERDGCLVGFHSQSSIDPERYTVWISTENHTWSVVEAATHLGVHLLAADQLDLAERFGGQSADAGIDKLAGIDWRPGPGGAPILAAVAMGLVGRITDRLDAGGDHVAVVLEPVEGWSDSEVDPLRYHQVAGMRAGHPRS